MNRRAAWIAVALAACSGRNETFAVAPDGKHVLIGNGTSLRSVDVDTLAEVGRVSGVDPGFLFFSSDGSRYIARSATQPNLIAAPAAGGRQVDLGPAVDQGAFSADGTRVAFLRNTAPCAASLTGYCAELFSGLSTGGEAVRVASGIRVQLTYGTRVPGAAYALYPSYQFAGNEWLLFQDVDDVVMSVRADGSSAPVPLATRYLSASQNRMVAPFFWVLRDGRVVVTDATGLVLMDSLGGSRVVIGDPGSGLLCDVAGTPIANGSCPLSAAGALAVLAGSSSSSFTVRLVSLVGGPSPTVTASRTFMHFDSDGRFVFFDPNGVLSEALPSGEVRPIAAIGVQNGLDQLSPDGKWATVSSQTFDLNSGAAFDVRVLSTVTGSSSFVPVRSISDWQFSPDSTYLLLRSSYRQLFIWRLFPDDLRLIETDVDQARWAGNHRIVINRTRTSPEGVSFLDVR